MDPEGLDGWLRKGQYEDLSMNAPPDEDKTDDEPEGLEDSSSAAWEHETRLVSEEKIGDAAEFLGWPRASER